MEMYSKGIDCYQAYILSVIATPDTILKCIQ